MCLSAWAERDSFRFAAKRVFPRTSSPPRRENWDSPLGTVTKKLCWPTQVIRPGRRALERRESGPDGVL
jgi:hypothetical protein